MYHFEAPVFDVLSFIIQPIKQTEFLSNSKMAYYVLTLQMVKSFW